VKSNYNNVSYAHTDLMFVAVASDIEIGFVQYIIITDRGLGVLLYTF